MDAMVELEKELNPPFFGFYNILVAMRKCNHDLILAEFNDNIRHVFGLEVNVHNTIDNIFHVIIPRNRHDWTSHDQKSFLVIGPFQDFNQIRIIFPKIVYC